MIILITWLHVCIVSKQDVPHRLLSRVHQHEWADIHQITRKKITHSDARRPCCTICNVFTRDAHQLWGIWSKTYRGPRHMLQLLKSNSCQKGDAFKAHVAKWHITKCRHHRSWPLLYTREISAMGKNKSNEHENGTSKTHDQVGVLDAFAAPQWISKELYAPCEFYRSETLTFRILKVKSWP